MHFLIFLFVTVAQFPVPIFYVLTFCTNLSSVCPLKRPIVRFLSHFLLISISIPFYFHLFYFYIFAPIQRFILSFSAFGGEPLALFIAMCYTVR